MPSLLDGGGSVFAVVLANTNRVVSLPRRSRVVFFVRLLVHGQEFLSLSKTEEAKDTALKIFLVRLTSPANQSHHTMTSDT